MTLQIVAQTPPPPGVDIDTVISSLIPVVGIIGTTVVTSVVLWAFFKSDIARAMAERIRAGMHRRKHTKWLGGEWIDQPAEAAVAGDERRVAQLEEQVGQLHGQVAELAERLDFAERLLAQQRGERTLRAGE
jgi:hypothetical protein